MRFFGIRAAPAVDVRPEAAEKRIVVPASLVFYPDPRLRKSCTPVRTFDDSLRELVEQMLTIMASRRGVGLAAPQVGVLKRLFVCNPTGEPQDAQVYVNPEIVEVSGSVEAEEGCLSIPGINVPVRRAQRCVIRACDLEGRPIERSAEDLTARIWQHETDHLDGVLILDRTTDTARLAIRRALRELESRQRTGRTRAAAR